MPPEPGQHTRGDSQRGAVGDMVKGLWAGALSPSVIHSGVLKLFVDRAACKVLLVIDNSTRRCEHR